MRGFTPSISWLESFLNRGHYLIILYMTTKRVSAPFDLMKELDSDDEDDGPNVETMRAARWRLMTNASMQPNQTFTGYSLICI